MRAKLKDKGDLAGVSSSAPNGEAPGQWSVRAQGGYSYCGIGMVQVVAPFGSYMIGPMWSEQKPRLPLI